MSMNVRSWCQTSPSKQTTPVGRAAKISQVFFDVPAKMAISCETTSVKVRKRTSVRYTKGKKTSISWKGVFSFRCWWVCHWGLRSRLWKYQRKLSLLLLSRISIGIKRSMCRWVELLTFLWHCSGKTGARIRLRQVERYALLSQKDNVMTEKALEVPTFQSDVILVYIYSDLVLVKR